MNTKLLMTICSVLMGVAGIVLSFIPHELLSYLNSKNGNALTLQILGALYFAFAMVNWTARANLIGGIYGRPIAIGNLTHFVVGSLALIKGYSSNHNTITLAGAIAYTVFAILFTVVFFRHPVPDKN